MTDDAFAQLSKKTGLDLTFLFLGGFLIISTMIGFYEVGLEAIYIIVPLWTFLFLCRYLVIRLKIKSNWKSVTALIVLYQLGKTAISISISMFLGIY